MIWGFIERLGYGIDRMIRLMARAGLSAPRFAETAAGFQVTLVGHGGAVFREHAGKAMTITKDGQNDSGYASRHGYAYVKSRCTQPLDNPLLEFVRQNEATDVACGLFGYIRPKTEKILQ